MYFLLFIFLQCQIFINNILFEIWNVKSNTKDNNIFYYEREKVYNIMSFFSICSVI